MADELISVEIQGMESFETQLSRLDQDIRKNIVQNALIEAGVVLCTAMKEHAPVRPADAKGGAIAPGALQEDIRVEIDMDNGYGNPQALIGPSTDKGGTGFVGRLVETGHRQMNHSDGGYDIVLTRNGRRRRKRHKNGGVVLGEVPPHPWAVPAFDEAANQALEAFGQAMVDGINKGNPESSETPDDFYGS